MSQKIDVCIPGTVSDLSAIKPSYVTSFAEGEQYNLDDYVPYMNEGCVRLDLTLVDGEIATATICELFDDGDVLLAYMWTREDLRNQGIGSLHLSTLVEILQEERPGAVVYLEVENPAEAGISAEESTMRTRRFNWYRRHGAHAWSGRYIMPNLSDKRLKGIDGILMAITPDGSEVSHDTFVERAIYLLVNSYEVSRTHRYVRVLEAQR